MRAFDWASTSLGPLPDWPVALRIVVDQMLASRIAACLFWGDDLVAIHNDAFVPILGDKPDALGRPMRETWAEVWSQVEPIARKALAGESTFIENWPLRIGGDATLEDRFFTFNYGPVFDENGVIVGVMDTVIETTSGVVAERQAREERERLQGLLRQMPGFAAVLSGPRHVFDYVNDAYVAISGPRRFIGRTVREVFPELAGQGFYEMLDRVFASGEAFAASAIPITLAQEDGRRHIDLLYEPIRDGAGAVQGIFVGGYDVTDRVRAEEGLRRSEAHLRALNAGLAQRVSERTLAVGRSWHISPDLLCVLDTQGEFTAVNPAFETMLGWTEAELTHTEFFGFVHPDDLPATRAVWSDMVDRGLPVLRFVNRWLAKEGGVRWISWVGVPETDAMYCIGRDVTEEREHARKLASRTAERDVLAAIVETTDAFIQVLDCDYRILAINNANADEFERVFGKRPVVGDSLIELFDDVPEHRDQAIAVWSRALAGESFTVQAEFGDANRTRRTYDMKFEVLRGADGVQTGAFLTSTDVTGRLREQRALAEALEALRQAQKMEAVGQLTGGIAHDFNNLLAAISGSLQVLQRRIAQGKSEGNERYIEMGESSVRRAAALTQRLLAFSRRQTLDPRPTDVRRLVEGMVDLIDRTVGPAVRVEVESGPAPWTTLVDPSQLENALLNLCINARDAMPDGGRLTLSMGNDTLDARQAATRDLPPGEYVKLCVADTGTGMAPAIVGRVFEPFFTTKPLGQGTGLGLSMVFGFVRQSGGQIHVESVEGRGTTMCMYLPRHAGDAVRDDAPPAHEPSPGSHGGTILLIEDESTVRQLLREVLSEAGHAVVAVEDGPAGLRVLQAGGAIDLLVTDVGLPGGMNGRQVADAGRVVRPGLKVLFITGYAESAAVGNGLMQDGMEVMTKPFEIGALVARVRRMLSPGA